MIELGREKRGIIQKLCEKADGVLVNGAVSGCMGRVWTPTLDRPSCCLIKLGDFAYLFGICPKGEQAMDLRSLIYRECSHAFLIPADERWEEWLEEAFFGEYRICSRYSMKKKENHFQAKALEAYSKALPEGFRIRQIDKKLYHLAMKEEWSRDFCANFESAEAFEKDGLGFVAMEGRKIVSGCSAYGISQGMMEIQVETRREYQGMGLALSCSAKFILTCLERGIYPNWDASNLQSVGLAEKLGYVFDKEYEVYQLKEEQGRLLMA